MKIEPNDGTYVGSTNINRGLGSSSPALQNDLNYLYGHGFFPLPPAPAGPALRLACPVKLGNGRLLARRGLADMAGLPTVYAECGADGWHLWCYDLGAAADDGPYGLYFDQFAGIGDVFLASSILFRRLDAWNGDHIRYRTDNRPLRGSSDRPSSYSQEALDRLGRTGWPEYFGPEDEADAEARSCREDDEAAEAFYRDYIQSNPVFDTMPYECWWYVKGHKRDVLRRSYLEHGNEWEAVEHAVRSVLRDNGYDGDSW